jgi:hypothetical protein
MMCLYHRSQGIGEPGTCAPSVQAVALRRYALKAPGADLGFGVSGHKLWVLANTILRG